MLLKTLELQYMHVCMHPLEKGSCKYIMEETGAGVGSRTSFKELMNTKMLSTICTQ